MLLINKKFKRPNLIEKLSLKTDFVHTVQKEKHGNQAEHQVKEEVLNLLLNSLTTKFLARHVGRCVFCHVTFWFSIMWYFLRQFAIIIENNNTSCPCGSIYGRSDGRKFDLYFTNVLIMNPLLSVVFLTFCIVLGQIATLHGKLHVAF